MSPSFGLVTCWKSDGCLPRTDAAVMLPDHQKHSAKDIEQTASRFANARAKYEAAKASSAGSDSVKGEQKTDSERRAHAEGSAQRLPEPMRPAAAFEGGGSSFSYVTVGRLAVLFARGLPYLICSLTQGQCAGEPEASFSGGSSAAVRMPRISRTPVQHLRGGYQSALEDLTSLTIRVRRMHHSVMQGQARSQAHGISLAGLKAE